MKNIQGLIIDPGDNSARHHLLSQQICAFKNKSDQVESFQNDLKVLQFIWYYTYRFLLVSLKKKFRWISFCWDPATSMSPHSRTTSITRMRRLSRGTVISSASSRANSGLTLSCVFDAHVVSVFRWTTLSIHLLQKLLFLFDIEMLVTSSSQRQYRKTIPKTFVPSCVR